MVDQIGLKIQFVTSFRTDLFFHFPIGSHIPPDQCGTNVGDACFIPLPQWVLQIGKQNRAYSVRSALRSSLAHPVPPITADIFYRDREGGADDEYLTLGVDNQPLFLGRTGLQLYSDFMSSLEQNFRTYLQKGTINQIQVGMGPAGTNQNAPFSS